MNSFSKLSDFVPRNYSRVFGVLCLTASAYFWYLTHKAFKKPKDSGYISWVDDDRSNVVRDAHNQDVSAEGFKVVFIKVPARARASIIGKQGCTIKKIQNSTKTIITFIDKGGPSMKSDVNDGVGTSAEGNGSSESGEFEEMCIKGLAQRVAAAEREIQAIVDSVPIIEEEFFTIDTRFVGCIIGKGGENIRRLKTDYNCKIEVSKNNGVDTGTRSILIQGSRSQIDATKNDISGLIRDIQSRDGDKKRNFAPNNQMNNFHIESGEPVPPSMAPPPHRDSYLPKRNSASMFSSTSRADISTERFGRDSSSSMTDIIASEGDSIENITSIIYSTSRMEFPRTTKPVNIKISSVTDCTHMSVQIFSEENKNALLNLVQEMTNYFSVIDEKRMPPRNLKAGDLIAAEFAGDKTWQRAAVHKIQPVYLDSQNPNLGLNPHETLVDLDFSDYGDCSTVPLFKTRLLTSDETVANFLRIPFQAIPVQLSGIKSKDAKWSEAAIECFEKICCVSSMDTIFLGYFLGESPDDGAPVLKVVNPAIKPPAKSELAAEMVRLGFAVWERPS